MIRCFWCHRRCVPRQLAMHNPALEAAGGLGGRRAVHDAARTIRKSLPAHVRRQGWELAFHVYREPPPDIWWRCRACKRIRVYQDKLAKHLPPRATRRAEERERFEIASVAREWRV